MRSSVSMEKIMLSMTVCAAELEMSARMLELSGEVDMAITLDNLAMSIRSERNNYCHQKSEADD